MPFAQATGGGSFYALWVNRPGASTSEMRKDHEPRENQDDYRRWLKAELGLDPIDDPAPLVAAAQARYKADFDAWMSAFV